MLTLRVVSAILHNYEFVDSAMNEYDNNLFHYLGQRFAHNHKQAMYVWTLHERDQKVSPYVGYIRDHLKQTP